ncbi:MAG: M1 family metallopeptidase [Actinomycetota bacterium]
MTACRAWVFAVLLAGSIAGVAKAASPALELQVELDPGSRVLKARAQVTPASRDFIFALHPSLEVASASADGKSLRVVSGKPHDGLREWRISLPEKADRLQLLYSGTLPPLDANLDHRDVLQGLSPMASKEGSFLPGGSGWYPQPGPLFSYRVTLSVPAGQRALVPGHLTSEQDEGGRYQASFDFPHPTDGIDLMAGPWVVREKIMSRPGAEPVRLRTYFFKDLDAIPGLADGYLEDTGRYLALYSELIGAYPFTEFSVVASPLPTGFGMPTLTYLGADVLKLPFIRATSLGHEVLHNWWGNGVYADYARGNWSEGLTTFMADYFYKERESAEAAREMRLGWLRDFAAVPPEGHQSLASFRSRTHGAAAAVGYGKSAMVFLMLRDRIGEEAFQRGIRTFWDKHRFKVATWDDLRKTFEDSSGSPLRDFFKQWVERAGGPTVKIDRATATEENGKHRLTLMLEQSEPTYALRLPIEIIHPGRTELRWVDLDKKHEAVTLDTDGQATGVRLDPALRVWRVLEPEQLPPILRQWIISPSPRLVLATQTGDAPDTARALAGKLLETPPHLESLEAIGTGNSPILLAGLHADVDEALARAGLSPRPANLSGRGSAQVWTVQRESGPPVAVISARDTDALRALLRPLPHYGSQSWLVFEGGRAIAKGVWSAPGRLIPVEGH